MKVAVWGRDLSDSYLKYVCQLGADAVDGLPIPNEPEKGYFDLDETLQIKKKIASWGMRINRVSLPYLSEKYVKNEEDAEQELEDCCQSLRVLGEAKLPLGRVGFANDVYPWMRKYHRAEHRGSYVYRGEGVKEGTVPPTAEEQEYYWGRVCHAYSKLVPIADEYGVKLIMHPSDPPSPDAPFGGLGFHRLIDAFPSPNVGYLYCCGTRCQAGGQSLVLDEVHNYGRKNRIFMVHFRNVRGSIATANGFEEVLLDDGDMNMFKILVELQRIGFDGCLNPDHCPPLEGDGEAATQSLGYAVGYIKAMLAALAVT